MIVLQSGKFHDWFNRFIVGWINSFMTHSDDSRLIKRSFMNLDYKRLYLTSNIFHILDANLSTMHIVEYDYVKERKKEGENEENSENLKSLKVKNVFIARWTWRKQSIACGNDIISCGFTFVLLKQKKNQIHAVDVIVKRCFWYCLYICVACHSCFHFLSPLRICKRFL